MKILNLLQLIFEIIVGVGYIIGLFPFGYIISLWWVIPLTIVNLVFAIISKNKTLPFNITNVVMAWISLIPIIGFASRIVGLIMSILCAIKVGKDLN